MKIYIKGTVPLRAEKYIGYIQNSSKMRVPFDKMMGGDMFLEFEYPTSARGKEFLYVEKGGRAFIED